MKYTTATLLALACCSAHAQSNVAIYGVVDAGLVLERGTPAGNTSNVSSGVASGSRLGFKGTEDLGNGLGVTDPVSGEVVVTLKASKRPPPKTTKRKKARK